VRRASFEHMSCSIARSLEAIGEWWTLLIVRDAFFGVTRFDDFQERLGIARNVLATRLDTLVDHGVLERHCYDEARGRYDYQLTEKGKALWPVLVTLRQWGDEWVMGEGNEPVELVHKTCGQHTTAVLTCDRCGEALTRRKVRLVAGPGLDDPSILPAPRARARARASARESG
jgi:DNA-binding HxlR family transcriptional regulator